jgi:hypothetical protein
MISILSTMVFALSVEPHFLCTLVVMLAEQYFPVSAAVLKGLLSVSREGGMDHIFVF